VCVYSLIYPACTAHAPYYVFIFGQSGSTTSSHIISLRARFSKERKKIVERTVCVLIFSINFVRNIVSLTRSERDSTTNVPRSSNKVVIVLVRFYWNFNFLDIFLKKKKTQKSIFMKIHLVGTELFNADRRTDRQTEMTKLMVTFRNFANAANKGQLNRNLNQATPTTNHGGQAFYSNICEQQPEQSKYEACPWSATHVSSECAIPRLICYKTDTTSQSILLRNL